MPLHVTPVNRNLQTRVTFMLLELEDLFIVLGAAAIMNVVGHFVGGEVAGMPMSIVLQYGVPTAHGARADGLQVWQAAGLRSRSCLLVHENLMPTARSHATRNPVGVPEEE